LIICTLFMLFLCCVAVISCPPIDVANATLSTKLSVYQTNVTIFCDSGYVYTGIDQNSASTRCQANGTWSPQPTDCTGELKKRHTSTTLQCVSLHCVSDSHVHVNFSAGIISQYITFTCEQLLPENIFLINTNIIIIRIGPLGMSHSRVQDFMTVCVRGMALRGSMTSREEALIAHPNVVITVDNFI
jgi:Sushi repeat (SCR repeat)